MSDLSFGASADLILAVGDTYRVSTGGVATVRTVYGAPAGTVTLTAGTQDFGPYSAPAKLTVSAVTGTASYAILGGTTLTPAETAAVKTALAGGGLGGGGGSPITVAGTPGAGNVLTATPAAGWTATGLQWVRDGATIPGATLSTYTQAAEDAGLEVTCRGTGLTYAASSVVVTATRTGVLRSASVFNRTASVFVTSPSGYNARVAFRAAHVIGSGDLDSLRLVFNNWATAVTTIANPGNAVTYSNLYLESAATGAVAGPLTVSASGSIVMAANAFDTVGDAILPSALGLTKFTRGDRYYIRGFVDIPASGNLPARLLLDTTLNTAFVFDPAATACANIGTSGALTFTGTAPTACAVPQIVLVGTFITGDPQTWMGCGDSIMDNASDTTGPAANLGQAFFSRALFNAGSRPLAGINAGMNGATYSLWVNGSARLNSLTKYCNRAAYEMGTNSFNNNAANDPTNLSNAITSDRLVYTAMRTAASAAAGTRAFKIVGTLLGPRTTGPYTTVAGQAVFGPKWDIAGDVDSYNTTRLADVGVAGRIDAVYDPAPVLRADPSSNASADYHKFAANATSDGLHPLSAQHALMATGVRAAMDAAF